MYGNGLLRNVKLQAPFQFAHSLYPAVLAIRPFQTFEGVQHAIHLQD